MFHRPSSKKGLTLRENNISRYNAEFHEVSKIGCGQFGTVYKCINRLDGCTYAVKKSRKPVAGSADEAAAMREVYAHAVIGSHEHIVRYYSAWAEDNHMIIQNEFCNGGNLADKLLDCVARGTRLTERELIHLMKQVAKGLQYIHSKGLVHLDIKPENIFLCYHESSSFSSQSDSGICCTPEDSRDEDRPMDSPTLPVYKIGDMGHVTSVSNPSVEEGDCRFLPKELLNNKYEDLPKADIFSLGLTVYTVATLQDLPKNGEEWHHLRDGHLMPLTFLSTSHNRLLQAMAHPDPKMRPTSSEVLSHQLLSSDEEKSRAELQKELQLEKMKNMSLQKELSRKQESSNDFHRRRFIRYSSSVF
jgi:wee1-like protein kinase